MDDHPDPTPAGPPVIAVERSQPHGHEPDPHLHSTGPLSADLPSAGLPARRVTAPTVPAPTVPAPTVPAPTVTAPHVPGLRLGGLLGRGAHGAVWAATDLGTGEPVAVKVSRAAARSGTGTATGTVAGTGTAAGVGTVWAAGTGDENGDADRARSLARESTLLRRLDHPHVIRLRRVVDLPDGTRALVLDLAAGGSLGGLVAARGPLDPAEVTTLVIGLARALADLHAAGVVHADLSPGNVLFTGDGRPLLADLGLAALLGLDPGLPGGGTPGFIDPARGPAGDPARDVWGLAAVAWFALTGAPPPPSDPAGQGPGAGHPDLPERLRDDALVPLLLRCLDVCPSDRPSAADLARLAWRCGVPAPIRVLPVGRARPDPAGTLGETDDDPADAAFLLITEPLRDTDPAESSPAGWWVRVVVASTAVAAVALVMVGVIVATRAFGVRPDPGRSGSPPLPGSAVADPEAQELARAVGELARQRAAALAAASTGPLAAVDLPGSPALAADTALVRRLAGGARRLQGIGFTVNGLRVLDRSADGVRVAVTVATGPYRQVRADGTVEREVPAGPPRQVVLELADTEGGGWRVRSARAP